MHSIFLSANACIVDCRLSDATRKWTRISRCAAVFVFCAGIERSEAGVAYFGLGVSEHFKRFRN